uniref:Uncharacterized protein n=1 Tax=Opuntia streptacantha TaxID=393608 RepID=A0A7C8ZUP7_OPUST
MIVFRICQQVRTHSTIYISQLPTIGEPWKVAKSESRALICSGCTSCPSLHCSAQKISMANPLKQLMTACWMSKPRPSKALIVDSNSPGLRPQNMWMLTALPSLNLTSILGG